MARKHKEDDIPGEVGKNDRASHNTWTRNEGSPRKMGPPAGNLNSMRHGIFANRFLAEEEKPLFESIIGQLYQDFVFNKSSDFMQVELVAIYFLKLGRAQEAGDWETAERLDRMIRCHLKDLKATKIAREGETPAGPETTPAEWATALLEKINAPAEGKGKDAGRPVRKNARTASDNTDLAEDEEPENAKESGDGESGGVE